uniref:Zinc knuckle CX2CX4HX4C domain-containing protein n=1 Tax=Cannabis sativa TaxID=3483 RepID=A0A803Q8N6_CANSA
MEMALSRSFRRYVPPSSFGTRNGFLVCPHELCGGVGHRSLFLVCQPFFSFINWSIYCSDDDYAPNLLPDAFFNSINCFLPFRNPLKSSYLASNLFLLSNDSDDQISNQLPNPLISLNMAARSWICDDEAWEIEIVMMASIYPILNFTVKLQEAPLSLAGIFLFKVRFRFFFCISVHSLLFCLSYLVVCVCVTMEDLNFNSLQPLTLTTDEHLVYTLDDLPSETPNEITLLLKLCTVKHFSRLSLIKTLSQVWTSQCRFPVVVSEHSEGLFLVTFGCEGDKRRILDAQPWHFSQSLTIFAAPDSSFPITPDQLHYVPFWIQIYGIPFRCKSYELAKLIATGVGDLIQVDSTTVKDGTGPYLRVRFLLDVNKPIRRGIHIRFLKMGREFTKWLDFKYERLSDFCFYCGKASEKPLPFQYPHAPTITIADVDISDFPQGGQVVNPYFNYSMGYTPLLNSHMAGFLLKCSRSSGLSSVSTDSVLVSANSSSSNLDLVAAARSLADALPSRL